MHKLTQEVTAKLQNGLKGGGRAIGQKVGGLSPHLLKSRGALAPLAPTLSRHCDDCSGILHAYNNHPEPRNLIMLKPCKRCT